MCAEVPLPVGEKNADLPASRGLHAEAAADPGPEADEAGKRHAGKEGDIMAEEPKKEDLIPLAEASSALASMGRRLALIHLSYARAIMDELGEERGTKVIARAIKDFGAAIGAETREEVLEKGLEATPENFGKGEKYALPSYPGLHDLYESGTKDGTGRARAHGCVIAKVFKEYGEDKLGRLYCYMDAAKYMGYNPRWKLAHTKTVPDGDECCEFVVKETTEEERESFSSEDKEWFWIDK